MDGILAIISKVIMVHKILAIISKVIMVCNHLRRKCLVSLHKECGWTITDPHAIITH